MAEKFLKQTHIDCIQVKITLQKTLKTIQGRIFSRKIINIYQEEQLVALREQKVVDIHKIMKRAGEKLVATGAAILTFDLINRPEKIKLGWEIVNMDEFIPNPMRCLNCQRLGRTKKNAATLNCAETVEFRHHTTSCSRKYCVNCQTKNHPSHDNECPIFCKHKPVNYLRIARRCTIREAWSIFNVNPTIHTLKPFQRRNKK